MRPEALSQPVRMLEGMYSTGHIDKAGQVNEATMGEHLSAAQPRLTGTARKARPRHRHAGPGCAETADDPLRGRPLRRAVCAVIMRSWYPCSVSIVLDVLDQWGYEVGTDNPSKAVADALAFEVDRRWLRRVERGWYAEGIVSRGSRHRILSLFP